MKMRFSAVLALSVAALSLSALPAMAQEKGTPASAKKLLQAYQDTFKAKGLKGTIDQMNARADCPPKQDTGCILLDAGATIHAATAAPMVGAQMPDMTDVDGVNVSAALVGPLKAGKTSWEAKYKLNAPGSKAIVPRHSFCGKLDATNAVCVTISQ
jgi:hypothetical protein